MWFAGPNRGRWKTRFVFRQKSLRDWCQAWRVEGAIDPTNPTFTQAYFDAMRQAGQANTQTFGLRLMGPDLGYATDWLSRLYPDLPNDHAKFEAAFGPVRYVHLSRQDKLAEAVSYLRAEQTGLWHSRPDGSDLERVAPTAPDGYDDAALTARMAELTAYDQDWLRWFDVERIQPLELAYEALSADPQGAVAQVLDHIGQDPKHAAGVQPGVRKLADATNAAWIARYRKAHPQV